MSSADLADTATVLSGSGGAFTVPAFPARAWTLQAEATITSGGAQLYAATGSNGPHAVAGGTTDLGSLSLQPYPFTGADPLTAVTGQATNVDGSAAAGAQVVIDTGDGQIVATAAGDGTFAVPGVPTLQGTIRITASLHLPCNVLLVGGPLTVSDLIAGGQTAVALPQLVPDPGPPPPIIFAAAPVEGWPAERAQCMAAGSAAGAPFATPTPTPTPPTTPPTTPTAAELR